MSLTNQNVTNRYITEALASAHNALLDEYLNKARHDTAYSQTSSSKDYATLDTTTTAASPLQIAALRREVCQLRDYLLGATATVEKNCYATIG